MSVPDSEGVVEMVGKDRHGRVVAEGLMAVVFPPGISPMSGAKADLTVLGFPGGYLLKVKVDGLPVGMTALRSSGPVEDWSTQIHEMVVGS